MPYANILLIPLALFCGLLWGWALRVWWTEPREDPERFEHDTGPSYEEFIKQYGETHPRDVAHTHQVDW
jgi:hypothetical protein